MTSTRPSSRVALEVLDCRPTVEVQEAEFRRLLGYPSHHVPGGRADELAAWAREWYAEHGRPWVYVREVDLDVTGSSLFIDKTEFQSTQLREHLRSAGARQAMLVAVSAGRACEEHARQLWQESKPDEYFFLEVYGSAVVEHLVASLSGRICDLAEKNGLMAVPHYSPGYTGWDIADQRKLFELISAGLTQPLPEPLEVMTSGMLRPKKSLLGVVGLAPSISRDATSPRQVPCVSCSLSPCQYRRVPYRHAVNRVDADAALNEQSPAESAKPPLAQDAKYTIGARALKKWAQERVKIEQRDDGSIAASFHFDGTTCSNMGHPLAFDYHVTLSGPDKAYTIESANCSPAPNDEGHRSMCAYLSDPETLMEEIASEKPLLGQPLNEVLNWTRPSAPSGCYCTADTRAHKWGLALEAIHFALAQRNFPSATPSRT
jgi:hypothetical protein